MLELLQYYHYGLLFAKNLEASEGVYNKLFLAIRNIYVALGPEKPAAKFQKLKPAAEKPAKQNGPFCPCPCLITEGRRYGDRNPHSVRRASRRTADA